MSIDFTNWTSATGDMPWGVQKAFKTALQAVADGDIKMVHGMDSYEGSPCLVNAINQMISHDASASPTQFAGSVVSAFDRTTSRMAEQPAFADSTVNPHHFVTPLMAEVLLANFGPEKSEPVEVVVDEKAEIINAPYVEQSDTALMAEWLTAQVNHAAEIECEVPVSEPVAVHVQIPSSS